MASVQSLIFSSFFFLSSFCAADHLFTGRNSLWFRSGKEKSVFSQRISHIGPVPHINEIMSEWTHWGTWQKCTRSCGRGVRSRKRTCRTNYQRIMPGSGIRTSHDRCAGDSVQYEVCGTQKCPPGQVSGISFRAAQCRVHNNKKVLGRVVNSWVPYTQGGINPCALVCEGEGEGIVYTFGKVTDGTYCKAEANAQGLCVNGRCLRLSCDGRLGGVALEDMCRVCGGRNETCSKRSGTFLIERPSADQPLHSSPDHLKNDPQKSKSFGYREVVSIPQGSTNVRVLDNSSNFLALKSGEKYLLNGDWLIDWPGEIDAAGVPFFYSRSEDQSEVLSSLGPTNSNLELMVLLREENPKIYYEYWITNGKSAQLANLAPSTSTDAALNMYSPSDNSLALSSNLVLTTPANIYDNNIPPKITSERPELKMAVVVTSTFNTTFQRPYLKPSGGVTGEGRGVKETMTPENEFHYSISGLSPKSSRVDEFRNLKKSPYPTLRPWKSNSVYETPGSSKRNKHKEIVLKNSNRKYQKNHLYYENGNKKRKKKKKKKKKKRRRPSGCGACPRKKKARKNFCTSDFVSRVKILNEELLGKERRLEALVIQSYKNKIPLLHKEFLWQSACSCRRLRQGKSYIVMGTTEKRRGNEVKLVLKHDSFVKGFSPKVLAKVMKFRQNEMRTCKRWRNTSHSSFKSYLSRFLYKRGDSKASRRTSVPKEISS